MGTNDSSNPAQCPLELVEILRQLRAHHRKVHEQTYDHPPWTHEQSAAYWHHPVVWVCKWLEQRLAIDRDELMTAAFRLTTPQGLRGMAPLIAPDGEPDKEDKGQPDWLWMIPKFRELDRDGTTDRNSTTTRLWRQLSEGYPTILVEAGIPVASQPPVVVPVDPQKVKTAGRLGRLPKDESKLLKTNMLAILREHSSLADDPKKLAELGELGESLDPNSKSILQAMAELQCDELNRTSAKEIIKTAIYSGDEKRAFGQLKRLSLVASKQGRNGGYWMTARGAKVAEKLNGAKGGTVTPTDCTV